MDLIRDYVENNKIDILALTKTWLKLGDGDEFLMRDVCPDGYVLNHVPRSFGTGGGADLMYKCSLKIEKLKST